MKREKKEKERNDGDKDLSKKSKKKWRIEKSFSDQTIEKQMKKSMEHWQGGGNRKLSNGPSIIMSGCRHR